MGSRKEISTKIPEDVNTDSGFISGTISGPLEDCEPQDSGIISGPIELESDDKASDESGGDERKCDEGKGDDKCLSDVVNLDSGVVCMSEQFDELHVDEESRQEAHEETRLPTLMVTAAGADLSKLAALYQQDDDGDTPLHISVVHGCQKSVGLLIRMCPLGCLLDTRNDYGQTALHLAVLSGYPVIARMLVRAGASLAMRDVNGDTPLHLATAHKNVDCLQALLLPVGSKPPNGMPSAINIKNYSGQKCVHLAANAGDRKILKILVQYKADINAKEGYAGWSPLHIAARRGDVRLAQCLLQCPGIDTNARDYGNRTPKRLAKRMRTFSSEDAQRLLAQMPDDSDGDDDSSDEDEDESPSKRVRVGQSDDWSLAGERDRNSGAGRRKLADRSDT